MHDLAIPVEEGGHRENGTSLMDAREEMAMDSNSFSRFSGIEKDAGEMENMFDRHESQRNTNNEEGEQGHQGAFENGVANKEDAEARTEGLPFEVATITRQATNQLQATLDETRELTDVLFSELTAFLNEAVAVQKDFEQVATTFARPLATVHVVSFVLG